MAANMTTLPCTGNCIADAMWNATADDSNQSIRISNQLEANDILTKEMADHIMFALECVVFPVVTVFGVTGNILSIIVLLQRKIFSGSGTVVLLIGITVADILFLVSSYMRKVTCIISHYDPEFANWYNIYTFQVLYYLKTAASRVSTYLVVAISVERFLAVCFPLKIKELTSKVKMAMVVAVFYAFTFSALLLIPIQFAPAKSGNRYYIVPTKFYLQNRSFLVLYNHIILPITFRWIPKVLVVVFNALICYCLFRRLKPPSSIKDHRMSVRKSREQSRVTNMLLVVAVVFVVCLIPGDIHVIVAEVVEEFSILGKYKSSFLAFSDISLLFEMINSSVNFIIYMALNKTFSSMYRSLFCRRCLGLKSGMGREDAYSSSPGHHNTLTGTLSDVTVNSVDYSMAKDSGTVTVVDQ